MHGWAIRVGMLSVGFPFLLRAGPSRPLPLSPGASHASWVSTLGSLIPRLCRHRLRGSSNSFILICAGLFPLRLLMGRSILSSFSMITRMCLTFSFLPLRIRRFAHGSLFGRGGRTCLVSVSRLFAVTTEVNLSMPPSLSLWNLRALSVSCRLPMLTSRMARLSVFSGRSRVACMPCLIMLNCLNRCGEKLHFVSLIFLTAPSLMRSCRARRPTRCCMGRNLTSLISASLARVVSLASLLSFKRSLGLTHVRLSSWVIRLASRPGAFVTRPLGPSLIRVTSFLTSPSLTVPSQILMTTMRTCSPLRHPPLHIRILLSLPLSLHLLSLLFLHLASPLMLVLALLVGVSTRTSYWLIVPILLVSVNFAWRGSMASLLPMLLMAPMFLLFLLFLTRL